MIDPMFFPAITISIVSFGIHSTLIVYFARRFDPLVVATYRALSLIVTMLPILLFATLEEVRAALLHAWPLLLSAGVGSAAFTISLTSSRYLPIGVGSTIRQTVAVPVSIVIGVHFLEEYLTLVQMALLTGIACCAVALTMLRSDHPHLDPSKASWGILLAIFSGFGSALAWYFFSIAARQLHPLVAAYFVEMSVAAFTVLYLVMLRTMNLHNAGIRIPFSDFLKIALIGMLTITGTGGYAFAVNYGPYPLASGLTTVTILVATVAAWLLYKEHLRRIQVVLVGFAVMLMLFIKWFS